MKKNRFLKLFKWLHKWPGLIAALFIVFWACSGIVLNHRSTFSSFSVNRSLLAQEYQYKNWNNGAIKGSIEIGKDSLLLYGNVGIWLSDNQFSSFSDFNQGFPKGIDHRKTFKLLKTSKGVLFAATLFGLYQYNINVHQWDQIELPIHEKKIISLVEVNDSLYVMSRSHLLVSPLDQALDFQLVEVAAHEGYDHKIGLFRTLWVIHSGEIYGKIGKLIVDAVAILFVFLTFTGLIYYLAPGIIKRKKKKGKSNLKIKRINKFSINWHNKLGAYLIIFLLITTTTGMFLRPPLLIAIANSRVNKIKFTSLDDPNPWNDRFRDLLYDQELNRFYIGTVSGIYHSNDHFKTSLKKFRNQPPISVMGINVFEKLAPGDYLVGSFYGLYRWQADRGYVWDHITNSRNISINRNGPPLGTYLSSGFIRNNRGMEFHLDYNRGAIAINHRQEFAQMPAKILEESPMSLWNFALEVHTARFFKFLFGNFYILVVPLLGLLTITILISGLIIWLKLLIRRTKKAH